MALLTEDDKPDGRSSTCIEMSSSASDDCKRRSPGGPLADPDASESMGCASRQSPTVAWTLSRPIPSGVATAAAYAPVLNSTGQL
jgi:hypothetical protein